MNYTPCRDCGYWVMEKDKHCPNCGVVEPKAEPSKRGHWLKRLLNRGEGFPFWGTILGAAFGVLAGTGLRGKVLIPLLGLMLIGSIFGMVLGAVTESPLRKWTRLPTVAGAILGAVLFAVLVTGMPALYGALIGGAAGFVLRTIADLQRAYWNSRSEDSLRRQEMAIQARLESLEERARQIQSVRLRLNAQDLPDLRERVGLTIEKALVILDRQMDCCRAGLWEIALIRWQNQLQPLLSEWGPTTTFEVCEKHLQHLAVLQGQAARMIREWGQSDLAATDYGQRCLTRLRQGLESCQRLKRALIEQQAILAVRGVAPMELASQPSETFQSIQEQFDLFHASVAAISEISSALRELEIEYERLHVEDQAAQQIEAMGSMDS